MSYHSPMILGKKILIVIPARGGSKGIPRKNLQILSGKSLLERVCNLAKSIEGVDQIICSTEDEEIANAALGFGVGVPFLRPKSLASDDAKTADVLLHALSKLEELGEIFDYLILLEPTSPLTMPIDVEKGLIELITQDSLFDSLITVCKSEASHPIFTFYKDRENKKVTPYLPGPWTVVRRQDIPELFFIEGSFYISKVSTFKIFELFVQPRTIGFEVPKWQSIEIDDEIDLVIAEAIVNYQEKGV